MCRHSCRRKPRRCRTDLRSTADRARRTADRYRTRRTRSSGPSTWIRCNMADLPCRTGHKFRSGRQDPAGRTYYPCSRAGPPCCRNRHRYCCCCRPDRFLCTSDSGSRDGPSLRTFDCPRRCHYCKRDHFPSTLRRLGSRVSLRSRSLTECICPAYRRWSPCRHCLRNTAGPAARRAVVCRTYR